MNFQERFKRRCEFDASLVYGTRTFNLLTKRDRHSDYRKRCDDQWLDPRTGVICQKFAQRRRCPLCGANNFREMFVKSGFPHVKCAICSLVYVNPILNKKEYEKFFSAEDSWESVLETPEQVRMQSLEARYSLDIARLYIRKKDNISICDVGCGPGTLLIEAKKRGYDVFGIEPNTKCHKILDDNGIKFTGKFFPLETGFREKFDCVFLLNTLEHLRDPLKVVIEVKKILHRGGIVYVSVPCIDALVNRVMQEKAGVFGGHSHLQFFSIKTLSALLHKAGFRVMEYETVISELGVISNYLDFQDPYFGESGDSLGFITPELIYRNHLARNANMVGCLK